MNDKLVQSNYYVNLYKIATELTNKLLQKQTKLIIASNCISLIAGISFNLLRQNYFNYCVINDDKLDNNDFDIILIITNNVDRHINKINYYFKYEGSENNILCLK